MNRRFALAGLMRVREIQEDRAAAELAIANRVRLEAQTVRDAAEKSLGEQTFPDEAAVDRYEERHAHELEAHTPTWRAIVAARASATAMLGEYNQAVIVAADAASNATEQWTDARTRAAMIDKLKARHDEDLVTQDLREEQIVLDEAGLRRSVEVTK